ncbi:Guanine nucleotide-binding protein subunit beta-1 [Hondaea fermentalgiana]|uniref:Guanine nucleotide-binding protein subunit beta-1 n=1 Tax=Hondaea fermentalgiana TaxID=2315210 RepID=A0A2R5GVP1_9STRA|nr:Guanine nucleotide-binding protein subunit beta-1 [Hondaea fermentalgiana]|eukprot:GBG33838.1 Guanine nucleotide-binding protein subunit beta-1 [Hondaea fermentalgiana]
MGRIRGNVQYVAQSLELVLAVSGVPNEAMLGPRANDVTLRAWSRDGSLVLELRMPNDEPADAVAVQGKLAAVGTRDGDVYLVNLLSGAVLHSLQGHTGYIRTVVIEDEVVLSGSSDGTIRIWDKASGDCIQTILAGGVTVCGLATHENFVVAGLYDQATGVRVFDRTTGKKCHELHDASEEVFSVAMNGRHMVSASRDRMVRVYAVPSFELVHVLQGHSDVVHAVALEEDLVVSGSYDHTVRVWDAIKGDQLHVLLGHSGRVLSVSLRGVVIVSGSADKNVRVWNANTGALEHVLSGGEHRTPISKVLAPERRTHVTTGSRLSSLFTSSVRLSTATSILDDQHLDEGETKTRKTWSCAVQ